jgi:hypothetical protein
MSNTNLSISGPAEGARRSTGARGGNRRRQGPLVSQAQSERRSGAASWRRSGVCKPQVWRHWRHSERVA